MRSEPTQSCERSDKMGKMVTRPLWVLNLSLRARAAPQVGAAVFLAAFLLDGIPGPPQPYVFMAFVSGGVLLFAEYWRYRQFHRELVGVVTLGKLIIFGAAWHGLLPPRPFVLLAFLLASVGAHLPKTVRHRLLY